MKTAFVTLAAVAALAVSAPAAAQSSYYVATPAAAPAKAKLITRSTPWTLRGATYVSNVRAPERDQVLCQLVVRDAGALTGFSAGGTAFDADQLAKCNAHAKGGVATAAR